MQYHSMLKRAFPYTTCAYAWITPGHIDYAITMCSTFCLKKSLATNYCSRLCPKSQAIEAAVLGYCMWYNRTAMYFGLRKSKDQDVPKRKSVAFSKRTLLVCLSQKPLTYDLINSRAVEH